MLPCRSPFPVLGILLCLVVGPMSTSAVELPSVAAAKVHIIEGLGKDTVPLQGAWQFHTGDDPTWASPEFDDSSWNSISAEQNWGSQGYYS
jgi:hypothetical protein